MDTQHPEDKSGRTNNEKISLAAERERNKRERERERETESEHEMNREKSEGRAVD